MHFQNVIRDEVGQVTVLCLIPYVFNRVEFWRVCRKPLDGKPVSPIVLQSTDCRTMDRPAITDEQQRTPNMAMYVTQESHDIWGTCVVVQQRVIQPESFRPRGAGEGRQCRDSVVSVPSVLQWRLANRSPHAAPQWLKQIATFVEKNQASFTFETLFLAAAIRRGATERSPVRFVLGHVAPASVDSSQDCAEACPRSPRGIRSQTVGESSLGPADMSTPKASNPNNRSPVSTRPIVPCAVRATSLVVGQDADGRVMTCCRRVSIFPSNGTLKKHYIRPPQPLPSTSSLARKAGLQSFDELPAPQDFLMVSCPQFTRSPKGFPLTT